MPMPGMRVTDLNPLRLDSESGPQNTALWMHGADAVREQGGVFPALYDLVADPVSRAGAFGGFALVYPGSVLPGGEALHAAAASAIASLNAAAGLGMAHNTQQVVGYGAAVAVTLAAGWLASRLPRMARAGLAALAGPAEPGPAAPDSPGASPGQARALISAIAERSPASPRAVMAAQTGRDAWLVLDRQGSRILSQDEFRDYERAAARTDAPLIKISTRDSKGGHDLTVARYVGGKLDGATESTPAVTVYADGLRAGPTGKAFFASGRKLLGPLPEHEVDHGAHLGR